MEIYDINLVIFDEIWRCIILSKHKGKPYFLLLTLIDEKEDL